MEFEMLLDYATSDSERQLLQAIIDKGGNVTQGIKLLGVGERDKKRQLAKIRARAAAMGYSPEHDMTKTAPQGFSVKGTSTLMLGDCLERMKEIPDGSVDMVLTDPPYGTTACKWDSIIPLEPMWEQLKRVIKLNGAIVMTASQPFTTRLIYSEKEIFKHSLIWDKCVGGAFVLAKKRILPAHEDILIFSKGKLTYNPQMTVKPLKDRRALRPESKCLNQTIKTASGVRRNSETYSESEKYPTSILRFPKQMQECNNTKRLHPTQKPVALMEYLIKTYTNAGDTVLDFTMGSGSTGVACVNTGRKFIGIELDENYFNIAKKRIEEA